ncbi:hypothetical protein BT67DRAFT_420845 [Trichocladium antarcticum]|uniref:MARVEL domain-containing protein n=1 Tax=Trichocladium antarcticum TaxID=1450529 RepID=A0AAN6UNU3_9PEZI|nr:hypothetical protein BT67DRAFT_420845 [Trichocladium antarcticum]
MDTRTGFWNGRIARMLLGANNFIILASSAIIVGILSYFLRRDRHRGTHIVYEEVIAVLTLFTYLFAVVLPVLKFYRGYMLPVNLVLSYLWLTSLIFSSQDYSGRRCLLHSPPLLNRCGLKHTVQAFQIIGFVFLFFNTLIEAMMWASHRGHRMLGGGDPEKDRPLATGTTTATTAVGTDGERVAPVAV